MQINFKLRKICKWLCTFMKGKSALMAIWQKRTERAFDSVRPFKYSSSCGTPCSAFPSKTVPRFILATDTYDSFSVWLWSILAASCRQEVLSQSKKSPPSFPSFFLSFTEGWFLTNASSALICWLFDISYWTLSFLHCSQRLRLYLNSYFYFGKHFHVNRHLLNISNGTN